MRDKETILPITVGTNIKYWLTDDNTKIHLEVDLTKEFGLSDNKKSIKIAVSNWRKILAMQDGELKETDMKMQFVILRPATDEDIQVAEDLEGLGYD